MSFSVGSAKVIGRDLQSVSEVINTTVLQINTYNAVYQDGDQLMGAEIDENGVPTPYGSTVTAYDSSDITAAPNGVIAIMDTDQALFPIQKTMILFHPIRTAGSQGSVRLYNLSTGTRALRTPSASRYVLPLVVGVNYSFTYLEFRVFSSSNVTFYAMQNNGQWPVTFFGSVMSVINPGVLIDPDTVNILFLGFDAYLSAFKAVIDLNGTIIQIVYGVNGYTVVDPNDYPLYHIRGGADLAPSFDSINSILAEWNGTIYVPKWPSAFGNFHSRFVSTNGYESLTPEIVVFYNGDVYHDILNATGPGITRQFTVEDYPSTSIGPSIVTLQSTPIS